MDRDVIIAGRSVRVHTPDAMPEGLRPMVLCLHPGITDGPSFQASCQFDVEADSRGWYTVYPNGDPGTSPVVGDPKNPKYFPPTDGHQHLYFNGGFAFGTADHVTYLKEVVGLMVAFANVDPRRIYVLGESTGSFMAYRMCCETGLFAAMASVSGSFQYPGPKQPTNVLLLQGDEDKHIFWGGGYAAEYPTIYYPATEVLFYEWSMVNGRDVESVDDEAATKTTIWTGARTTELVQVKGGGHNWPGQPPQPGGVLLGLDPFTTVPGSKIVADFFEGFTLG